MPAPDTLYFVSQNPFKLEEISPIAAAFGIKIVYVKHKIDEPQTLDMEALIRDKARQAFEHTMLPILVDHGGLHLKCLDGMPGPLTQLFWDILGGRICNLAQALGNSDADASCTVGICDGYRVYVFSARKAGTITSAPRGDREFQWDTIFIPVGHKKTYAEMSIRVKNRISQRRDALTQAFQFVRDGLSR